MDEIKREANKCLQLLVVFCLLRKIARDQISLVGVGGGASALLPYTAEQMKLNYSIPEYAEVISSIGVALAAKSMNLDEKALTCDIKTDIFYIFTAEKDGKRQLRLLDKKGFIKVQRADADAVVFKACDWETEVAKMWEKNITFKAHMEFSPDMYLCIEGKVLDYAGTLNLEQLKIIMGTEFVGVDENEEVILIGAKSEA